MASDDHERILILERAVSDVKSLVDQAKGGAKTVMVTAAVISGFVSLGVQLLFLYMAATK